MTVVAELLQTPCARLNRWASLAADLGLDVRVEAGEPDSLFESYTMDVTMPRLSNNTALDSVYLAHKLHVYAHRMYPGSARPFKINALEFRLTQPVRKLPVRMVHWTITGLGDDLRRWIELRGESPHTTPEENR